MSTVAQEGAHVRAEQNWIVRLAALVIPGKTDLGRWSRFVLPVAVVTLLGTWIMLGELDSLLKGMLVDNDSSFGMSALTTGSSGQKADALEAWRSWSLAADGNLLSAGEIRTTYVWIDFWFLFAYTLVFLGAIVGLWRRIPDPTRDNDSNSWLELVNGSAYLLFALVVLDVVENFALLVWPNISDIPSWVLTLPMALSWLKLLTALLLVLALIYISVAAPLPASDPGAARIRGWVRGLAIFRVPLIVLALLAVLMLAVIPMGFVNQVPDLIRRWTGWHFGISIAATAAVVSVVWIVSAHGERRYRGEVPAPTPSGRMTATVAWVIVAAGLLQIGAWLLGATGLGLVVPAAFVGLLWVAQRLLPAPPRRPGGVPRIVAAGTSRVLAASVMALLGASMLNAAVPELLDSSRMSPLARVLVTIGMPIVGLFVAALLVTLTSVLRSARSKLKSSVPLVPAVASALVLTTLLGILLLPDPGREAELPLWLTLLLGVVVMYSAVAIYLDLKDPLDLGDTAGSQKSIGFYFEKPDEDLVFSRRGRVVVSVGMFCAIVITVWILLDPAARAPRIGGAAIVMLALVQLAVIGLLLTQFTDHAKNANALALLGFKRFPVFLFVFTWIAIVAIVPSLKLDSFHNVRITNTETLPEPNTTSSERLSDPQAECLEDRALEPRDSRYALERWKCINTEADGAAVPLVIVSAWGGGIRAAVWTALVMDCLFEAETTLEECRADASDKNVISEVATNNSDLILGLSGVSGGALGFLEYAARVAERSTGTDANQAWVEERLGGDYVSPTLAWMLYVDIPLSLVGFVDGLDDRADILEKSWERSWGNDGLLSQGLISLWESNARVPTVLANGTSFSDGCGLVSAPIAGASRTPDGYDDCATLLPGTTDNYDIGAFIGSKDLLPYLCDGQNDVRLSTAALLSARFPFVTPSGRVTRNCDGDSGEATEVSYVIDGGYREGSGALSALQLWEAIEDAVWEYNADNASSGGCIVPFMIHIENGYSPPSPQQLNSPVPNEWLVPGQGQVGDGLAKVSRATAAARFNEPVRAGADNMDVTLNDEPLGRRYAFITTRAHPGVSAPLGWTLSSESFDDLKNQLASNRDQIRQIQAWLNGNLECD